MNKVKYFFECSYCGKDIRSERVIRVNYYEQGNGDKACGSFNFCPGCFAKLKRFIDVGKQKSNI